MVGVGGVEPPRYRLRGECSGLLSYTPVYGGEPGSRIQLVNRQLIYSQPPSPTGLTLHTSNFLLNVIQLLLSMQVVGIKYSVPSPVKTKT